MIRLLALVLALCLTMGCGDGTNEGDDMKATLVWSPNTETDLASYLVYRSVAGAPFALLATVPKGTTTYTDDPLPLIDGDVAYYLTAKDQSGNESLHSLTVVRTINAIPPQAPTGLSVVVS
jgi:hypothetical protein